MPTNSMHAAKPTKEIFDAFNSSATGHQRAENRLSGSTLWRDSRHLKLREQFASGAGGGKRVSDTVGAGSDGSVKMGLTEAGRVTWYRPNDQPSLQETLLVSKDVERPAKRARLDTSIDQAETVVPSKTPVKQDKSSLAIAKPSTPDSSPSQFLSPIDPNSFTPLTTTPTERSDAKEEVRKEKPCPQIFANMTVYINGSTAPAISDHKLKRILTQHGANMSISLGRRTVTHVIIGRPNKNGGSGGGLAGSKIQKEISGKRLESVRYVTAEWVIESVKAGKRLSERRFEALRLAPKGVGSVASIFGAREKAANKTAKGEMDNG